MKLLLDQGLPRSTIQHLAAVGIVAQHVGDLGMANAEDIVILEFARQQQAVVVSLDALSVTEHRMRIRLLPIGR